MPAGKAYTVPEIYVMARKAGFGITGAVQCAAIAMAESSGVATATSSNPDGGTNVGLMQLDTPGGEGAGYTVAQLKDPTTNLRVALARSNKGTNWSHWATWPTAAKKFMPDAVAAANKENSDDSWLDKVWKGLTGEAGSAANAVTGAIGQVIGLPSQVTDFLTALEKPVQALTWFLNPANWARLFSGALGFLLLGAGLITLMKAA